MAADIEASTPISGQSRKRKRFSHIPKLLANEKVEVRSLEDGFLGSWHNGTVIKVKNQIRVIKYDHLLSNNGSEGLIESIPMTPFGNLSYRSKIRPLPPCLATNEKCLHYGQCVDVFHQDSWWEGVVFDHNDVSKERLVFFPDLGDELMTHFGRIRFTQDWDACKDQWKLRGDWVFLEVLEELEQEWPVLVSIKQIWYEVRIKKSFLEAKIEWTCPVREIWKETVKEVILDNFTLTMKEFFGRFDIKEPVLDNITPSFYESLSVIPYDPYLDDDIDTVPPSFNPNLDDDIDKGLPPLDPNLDDDIDTGPPPFDPNLNDDIETGPPGFSSLTTNDTFVDLSLAEPGLLPEAKCYPDAINEYYNGFISGDRPSSFTALKVRQHILYLGWKIEFKKKAHRHKSFRYRYIDPSGTRYFTLQEICKELSKSSCGNTTRQTVVDYYLLTLAQTSDLRTCKKDSVFKEKQNQAKKHLFDVGWSRYEDVSGRRLLVYSSPSGQKFQNLSHACKNYISESFCGPNQTELVKIKKKKDGSLTNSRNGLGLARLLRSRKRARKEASPTHQTPRTVLSWLIDNNIILPRSKVYYRCGQDGQTMKEGRVTRDGIKCGCCNNTFSVGKFVFHAGNACRRPWGNVFLEDGRSLLDCQFQLKNHKNDINVRRSKEEVRKVKGLRYQLEKENDYICSVCHYGGDLVLCDQCPSSFHTRCLGLNDVPDGEWFCPSCCCRICNENKLGESCEESMDGSILNCEQCERRYHIGCFKRREGLSKLEINPNINWFCGPRCEEIFTGLQALLGKPIPMGPDDLTWTLLKHKKSDQSSSDMEEQTEIYSKLNVVINVMHECFEPVKEPLTRRDIVEDVIFCKWSELNRLNFKGFYTILLEKDDELISAATVRVYGEKVAEIPLVGTRFQHRRRGMCHILMNELEKKLVELGVERLVLPAVSSVLHTWTTSFGFSIMTEPEKLDFLGYTFLDFQGTKMCHKYLPRGQPSTDSILSRGNRCDVISKVDTTDLDGISFVCEEGNGGNNTCDTPSPKILTKQLNNVGFQSDTSIEGEGSMEEAEDFNGNDVLLKCYQRRKIAA